MNPVLVPLHIPPMIARGRKAPGVCEWFLLCGDRATESLPHPTLDLVPTCQRCAEKVRRLAG